MPSDLRRSSYWSLSASLDVVDRKHLRHGMLPCPGRRDVSAASSWAQYEIWEIVCSIPTLPSGGMLYGKVNCIFKLQYGIDEECTSPQDMDDLAFCQLDGRVREDQLFCKGPREQAMHL